MVICSREELAVKTTVVTDSQQIESEMYRWIVHKLEHTQEDIDTIRSAFDTKFPGSRDFFESAVTELVYD